MLQNYFNTSSKSNPFWFVTMILASLLSGSPASAFATLKNASTAAVVLIPGDNDNDGVADNVDLDNDNDGILDSDEGRRDISHDLIWLTEYPNTNVDGEALYSSFSGKILKNKDTYGSDISMKFTLAFSGQARNPIPSSSGHVGGGSGETQEASGDGGQPNGIEYLVDWQGASLYVNDKTQYATYTYEFSKEVRLDQFSFMDIDREEYVDALKIKAYVNVGGVDVEVPLNAVLGSRVSTWNDPWNAGDVFYYAPVDRNNTKTDSRGFVVFDSGDLKITKIVITATSAMGAFTNGAGTGIPSVTSRFMFGDLLLSTDTDTDRDGIPNYQDNDTDNDGCSDAIEGSGTFTSSSVNSNGQLTGSVDSLNGIPTAAGSGQATNSYVTAPSIVAIITNPADKKANLGDNVVFDVNATYKTTTIYTGTAPNTTPDYSSAVASTAGMSYSWQVNTGSGFVNLTDDSVYSGTSTATLSLTAITSAMYNYEYQVVITNANNSCTNLTSSKVKITNGNPPVANDDTATTNEDTVMIINVITNSAGLDTDSDNNINAATVDLDPSTSNVIDTNFSVIGEGTYSVDNLGNVTFTPVSGFTGTASPINYTVQDNAGLMSNIATLTITVTAKLVECEVGVFNAITPNNDGENDTLQITGIECYPNNSIQIFNRWGVLVFEKDGYNNTDGVFKGISEGRATLKKSDELPAGTYFYILKYTDNASVSHDKSGYLYISK